MSDNSNLSALEIPTRWKSFVYVVGMLGFPIVIASYILVVLSSDLKQVDKSLNSLSTRIDERPMGLEKTTDFVVYLTDSLRADLQADAPELINSLNYKSAKDKESLARTLTVIKRELEAYIRPIVRKHQRFASRFPTEGGNIGSFFRISAPGEDIEAGETEAHLRAKSTKDLSEALVSILVNNISQFGNIDLKAAISEEAAMADQLRQALGLSPATKTDDTSTEAPSGTNKIDKVSEIDVINKDIFLQLTLDSIETATTVLRDQMLEEVRLNSTRLER